MNDMALVTKLSPKKDLFALYYAIDPNHNGRQAAINAGYTQTSAKSAAARLMTDPLVLKAIEYHKEQHLSKLRQQVIEKAAIDATFVLTQSVHMYKKCEAQDEHNAALRALELVGKHVDVQAFKDKIDIVTRTSHEDALEQLERGITIEHDPDTPET